MVVSVVIVNSIEESLFYIFNLFLGVNEYNVNTEILKIEEVLLFID